MPTNLLLFYLVGIISTFLISGVVYFFSRKSRYEVPTRFLWIIIAASGYIFFVQYFKYASLHMYTDFGHWLGVLQSIITTGKPLSLTHEFIIPGTLNYFSAHFVPLIYLFAIPFKMIPRPETLMVLNVALMLSAAIPLYKLARRMQGNPHFSLFAAALLLWYPTFQYITLYEFEMLRFSIPILLWMLYFFEMRRTLLYLLFVVLAVLVREEVGLTVAMFGIYAFFFAKRRKEGLIALLSGLGGFWLITSMLMPLFRGEGVSEHIAAGLFGAFGRTPVEVLAGILKHPFLALQIIAHPLKLANVFMLGLPLLFLPLGAPSVLLGSLASIGTGLLSNSFAHSSYMLYYIAPSVPFIFYALLKAWPKVTARLNASAAMNAVLVSVLISNIFFGPSPISLQFWFKNIRPAPFRTQDFHWSAYRVTEHHRKAEEFLVMIPEDAIASVPQFLHPRFYKKKGTLMFPKLQSKDRKWQAEYVLLDTTNNGLKPESPAYATKAEMVAVRESNEWELLKKSDDGYELYHRLENYK